MNDVLIFGHRHDDFFQLLIQGGFLFCLPVYSNTTQPPEGRGCNSS